MHLVALCERHAESMVLGAGPSLLQGVINVLQDLPRCNGQGSLVNLGPVCLLCCRDSQADSGDAGGTGLKLRRKRSTVRRSPYTVQNLLVVLVAMSCIGTMVFYFLKLQPGAPLTPAPVPIAHGAERPGAVTAETPK